MRYRAFFPSEDDIEDAFGFALDMDDILGGSSPSRRVSFTTSSERDRPFVRPPAPLLMKPRAQTRAKKAPASTAAPVATPAPPENPRAMTVETDGSSTSIVRVSALPQEMPPRPSTPARPRTRLASPVVRAPAVAEDVDGVVVHREQERAVVRDAAAVDAALGARLGRPRRDGAVP